MRLKAGGIGKENTETLSDSGENILGHIPSDKGAALERRGEQMEAAVRVLGRTHRPSNKTC